MKRLAYVALALFILSFVSGSYAAWWNSNCIYGKGIKITAPAYDLNKNVLALTGIDLTSFSGVTSTDYIHVVYNPTNDEVAATIEGNLTSTDANIYIDVNHIEQSVDNWDYNFYYGAGSCPARTMTTQREMFDTFEDNEYDSNGSWFRTYNSGAGTTVQDTVVKNGSRSLKIETDGDNDNQTEGLTHTLPTAAYDFNFSTWARLDTLADAADGLLILALTNTVPDTPAAFSISRGTAGQVHYRSGGAWVNSGYTIVVNTWYRFTIDTNGTGSVYRIFDTSGTLLSEKYAGTPGRVDTVEVHMYDKHAANVISYLDDTTFDTAPSPTVTEQAEQKNGVNANFVYTTTQVVSGDKVIIHFDANDSSTYIGGTVFNKLEWFLQGTKIGSDVNLNDFDLNYGGDYNVTLRVTDDGGYVDDENKLIDINAGFLQMFFQDENTGATLNPTTLTVNGTADTTTTGLMDFDLNNLDTADYTVLASLVSYTQREWFWEDLNQFAQIDLNATLLLTTRGKDVDFKFYAPNQTSLLTSTEIELRNNDINVSSRKQTDSSGELTFFLNHQDFNYWFRVYDNNGEIYDYNIVIANFLTPKDESSLAAVTPYDLEVKNIGSETFDELAAAVTVFMLPNTKDYYELDLNCYNDTYSRTLAKNYKGNPITDEIQMYCTPDSGQIQTTFYTKNASDLSTEIDILIRVYKDIAGEGTVEIESITTDAAGTAIMFFIEGDDYTFYFYDSDGTLLFSRDLKMNFTSYYVYIDREEVTWGEPVGEYVAVDFTPDTGYIEFDSSGADVNIIIDTNGTISTSWLTVANHADSNLSFNTSCGSSCGYTIREADINSGRTITVTVMVETSSGLIVIERAQYIPIRKGEDELIPMLRSAAFRTEWGCSPDPNQFCFFLLMLSAFLIIATLAAAGTGLTTDISALGIIVIAEMAIFTYLTWIPTTVFILAMLGVFGSMAISRRWT